jgi:P27 family predicted phage terminase small subunit
MTGKKEKKRPKLTLVKKKNAPGQGRKPKPTKKKLLEGEPNKNRINFSEPNYQGEIKRPPYLDYHAKKKWDEVAPELIRSGVLKVTDVDMFAGYCMVYSKWRQSLRKLNKMGYWLVKGDGQNRQVYQNPIAKTADDAMSQMLRLGVEFGLSPSSRSRITTIDDDGDDFDFTE